jgi:hypothetical protein
VRGLVGWWRQGESNAEAVYPQSLMGFVAATIAAGVLMGLIPAFRTWYVGLICLCTIGRALVERRRAYIFKPLVMSYRPAFGPVIEINFADIVSVDRCTAPVPFLSRPGLFSGVRIGLKERKPVVFPLDFPQSAEIWSRLLRGHES